MAEGQEATLSIPKKGGQYSPKSWSFKESSSSTGYDKAEVAYTDPKTGTTHKATVKRKKKTGEADAAGTGGDRSGTYQERADRAKKTMILQNRAENPAQAAKQGRAALHDANSKEQTASIEIMGCPRIVAGQTIALEDFGDFSGTYFIKTATHKISGSGGYSTSLELAAPNFTEEGEAHEEKSEAALAAKEEAAASGIGEKETAAQILEKLAQDVLAFGDDLYSLILCLPEIAAAVAEREGDINDRQGYLYLSFLFEHWMSSRNSLAASPFEISWQWAWQYARLREEYKKFTAYPSENERTIFNEAARQQLEKQLCQQGFMQPGRTVHFDFINAAPADFQKYHHTSRKVPYDLLNIRDGLFAALGEFSLWALASGHTESLGNGKYRIVVDKIAVAIADIFNFEQDTEIGKWLLDKTLGLLWWSCKYLDGATISPIDPDYFKLDNKTFRNFGEQFNVGSNFLVFSAPHVVENFTGASYEAECAN